jgi:hypothetical protein
MIVVMPCAQREQCRRSFCVLTAAAARYAFEPAGLSVLSLASSSTPRAEKLSKTIHAAIVLEY